MTTYRVRCISPNNWVVVEMLWPLKDILENPIESFHDSAGNALLRAHELCRPLMTNDVPLGETH